MADPAIVNVRRYNAERKIIAAAEKVGSRFGVALRKPVIPQNRYPDLYAAEQLEFIAAFLEELAARPEQTQNRKERVSA